MSETRAEFSFGQVRLTSKLIDGSFPDYTRVIPQGNDKILSVDRGLFSAAVDRVSTISSEKSRSVKLSLSRTYLPYQLAHLKPQVQLKSWKLVIQGTL